MKLFIKKLLFFIAPIILLLLPLDLIISHVLKGKSLYAGEYEVWNDIFESKIDAKIAVYGSSRAWVHFNPLLFEKELHQKTYNFGIDGHNFWLQYLRHKEYFKYNPHPKLIIYSVDIFTLAKRKDLYNLNQFLPYMLWNKDIYKFTKSYNGFDSLDYFIPLKRFIGRINILDIISSSTKIRYKGFKGNKSVWNNDLKKAEKSRPNFRVELDSASISLFNIFLKDLKKKNINVVFVYTPEYFEGQTYTKNRKEIIMLFNRIAKEYDIPFFDYSYARISEDKSLFYNTQHLNKTGADLFTRKFINDYKKYERSKHILNKKKVFNDENKRSLSKIRSN